MKTDLRGTELLLDPRLTKSTAFTAKERESLGLVGLLPDAVEDEDLQIRRVHQQLGHKNTDLDRYIYLNALLDHDETLFYKVLMSDPAHFLPIVYDPTIAEACLKFGHIYRGPRGMYLSLSRKGHVRDVLRNWPEKDVRVICVTDGGRILGLGDIGANGMGIPIGKLQLYTATAAVPPRVLLPAFLDAGTNNDELLHDPLYLGLRRTRPRTEELYEFVDEFVSAVQDVFPLCCIHFEDWTGVDAVHLLKRYRDKVCCYNDDIQGTAAVTLAGLMNAVRIKGSKLSEERILFLGAGSAGIGIADLVASAMRQEGLSEEEARGRISLFDIHGLIESSRKDLEDFQKPYAHSMKPTKDFVEAIEAFKPTAIIGVSTVGKAFNKKVVEAMGRLNHRPIIFALSNPTDHAECTPREAYGWTNGRAIYAAGVQFPPLHLDGKTLVPSQANNVYIFPAMGMAIYATQAKRVTDEMFVAAAKAVADQVTQHQLDDGMLFPPQSNLLEVELDTASKVAESIFEKGLARVERPDDVGSFIRSHAYEPRYPSFTRH
ncbi:NAD-dependent malic enzyme [Vulgatibacter incomptus]|uniref:NAD-dependent malic enzyme n=1 Tax=Vulgatibacter incomptus TaxID=1391653 RepID=A0A0K1PGH8_9BACT|nr:NAD-dependent malic enzyme [Vulgatibacter incomptus]AKU92625.1 NAD-dependent malic enzyme [Vulgatibacter incomptus]